MNGARGWVITLSLLLLLAFVWNFLVATGVIWADMGDPDVGGYPLIVAKDGVQGMEYLLRVVLFGQSALVFMLVVRTGLIEFGWPGYVAIGLAVVAIAGPSVMVLLLGVWAGIGLEFIAQRAEVVPRWWMVVRLPFTVAVSLIVVLGVALV
ncbi:hypothetical protein RXV86_19085 [Alisedimentitalea sp. MJ-SS2]|uniref:hypothetical protein n=1 Tax=Aliisedimentitalea sp. MJ-SS2 TaxID=3049795 RepID=UPI00290B0F81|nr:hypothetical protein [Alisedimentitalea sp. MJ-SS2]MDU8929499.1 hypothetical protein [Alisedimentitalea sp. MJ-SS2]